MRCWRHRLSGRRYRRHAIFGAATVKNNAATFRIRVLLLPHAGIKCQPRAHRRPAAQVERYILVVPAGLDLMPRHAEADFSPIAD